MHHLFVRVALASGLLGCASAPVTGASDDADLIIANVSVFDVDRGAMVPSRNVAIRGDRIIAITTVSKSRSARTRVIDGTHKYLIPGLWDMHAHVGPTAARVRDELPLFIAHGVTGLRIMSSVRPTASASGIADLALQRRVQSEVEAGTIVGPHLLAIGSWPTVGVESMAGVPDFTKSATSSVGQQLAQYYASRGFDFVKIYDDFPHDDFLAFAAEARSLGLMFAGHEPRSVSAIDLSRAGMRSVEHSRVFLSNCFAGADSMHQRLLPSGRTTTMMRRMVDEHDAEMCAGVFRTFARNHTYITPTHVTRRMEAFAHDSTMLRDARLKYLPIGQRVEWLEDARAVAGEEGSAGRRAYMDFYIKGLTLTNAAYRAGVPLMLGTDANDSFVFPGSGVHDELAELVKAGLTPAEALRAATIAGATFLGRTADFGSVRVGRKADVVLLDADPLRDIANVRRISAVMVNGRVFQRAVLDSLLMAAEVAARPTAQQRLWAWSALGDTAEVVSALAAGARIDSLNPQGNRRALNYAAIGNRADVVAVLLARGANPNLANRTGFTPLHHAVEGSAIDALRVLLARGVDLTARNSAGLTALEMARLRKVPVAVELLEAAQRRPPDWTSHVHVPRRILSNRRIRAHHFRGHRVVTDAWRTHAMRVGATHHPAPHAHE